MYNDNEQLEKFASHGKTFMWLMAIGGAIVGFIVSLGYGIYRLGWRIFHWDWSSPWPEEK